MSLVVWYPFTKDLENKGLSNITETLGSGVSLVNSNKFGTSASFDNTTNGYIRLDNFPVQEAFGQSNWSLAFWINYQNNEQRAIILGSFANSINSIINFEINGNSRTDNALRVYWYTGTKYLNYSSALTLDANTWVHVVIAYNGTDIKFYKNSILVDTKTASLDYSEITTDWYIGTDNRLSNKLKGELHDFRVYNHTLSTKEIKELSKGLILHYDLKGDNTNSGTYLYDDVTEYDLSGNGYNGIKQGITYSTDTPRYNLSSEFDANKDLVFTDNRIYHDGDEVSNLSVSIWFNPINSESFNNVVFSLNDSNFIRMQITSTTNMHIASYMNDGIQYFNVGFGQTIELNNWYHTTITFDNGIFKFYVNGNLISTTNKSSIATTMKCNNNTGRWSLGDYIYGNKFIGKLSDFRIYATTLSADDVKALYNISAQIDNSGKLYCGALVEE